jgi:hypothetical protein
VGREKSRDVNPLEQLFVQLLTLNLGACKVEGHKNNQWKFPKMGVPAIIHFDRGFMDFPLL